MRHRGLSARNDCMRKPLQNMYPGSHGLVLVLVLACGAVLTSCSPRPSNSFLGTWRIANSISAQGTSFRVLGMEEGPVNPVGAILRYSRNEIATPWGSITNPVYHIVTWSRNQLTSNFPGLSLSSSGLDSVLPKTPLTVLKDITYEHSETAPTIDQIWVKPGFFAILVNKNTLASSWGEVWFIMKRMK